MSQIDCFKIEAVDLGTVEMITVGHDGKGIGTNKNEWINLKLFLIINN